MADILVFGAHPDDAEFGMGASMLKFMAEGLSVALCVLTRGEAGTYGSPEERERELKEAAGKSGVLLELLDFRDLEVIDSIEGRMKIADVIRKYRPAVVFAPYHSNRGGHRDGLAHPDHIAVGNLARFGARYARMAGMKGLSGEPWNVGSVFYYMVASWVMPTFILDVTDFMGRWEEVAGSYRTQLRSRDGRMLEILKESRKNTGELAGFGYGEAFISDEPLALNSAGLLKGMIKNK